MLINLRAFSTYCLVENDYGFMNDKTAAMVVGILFGSTIFVGNFHRIEKKNQQIIAVWLWKLYISE